MKFQIQLLLLAVIIVIFEDANSTTDSQRQVLPTWRPRRMNCTPPIIEEFPRPHIRNHVRKHGGLTVHFIVALFAFIGVRHVCQQHFVPAVLNIKERFELTSAVVGGTLMTLGSSTPIITTSMVSLFFAKDDAGVENFFGSSSFFLLFSVSICAFLSNEPLRLNRLVFARNYIFNLLTIVTIIVIIRNEVISWVGSLVMLFLCLLYVVVTVLHKDAKGDVNEPPQINSDQLAPSPHWTSKLLWMITYPIERMSRITVPDKNRFFLAYTISLLWISFYSIFLVWMAVIISSTLGFPSTIIRTFVIGGFVTLAGTVNSIELTRRGHGDMAIANLMGSNILSILIGLGIPAFIQTIILFSATFLFMLLSIWITGWRINKKLAGAFTAWFVSVTTAISLYDLNVFGPMNPNECHSMY